MKIFHFIMQSFPLNFQCFVDRKLKCFSLYLKYIRDFQFISVTYSETEWELIAS